ncbi:MAG: hypothetical protein GWQ05_22090 [Verrucomicrobiaceae bacterium]|nr:hypothetical protein [Verrucomicrobiaceae bacterium]
MNVGIWDSSVTVPAPAVGQVLRLTGENPFFAVNWSVETHSVAVTFTLKKDAPENGVFPTPVWLGVHDGTFDLFTVARLLLPVLSDWPRMGIPPRLAQYLRSLQVQG